MRAFARSADIDDKSLRQYIAGKTDPSRSALLGIARAGNVTLQWLATGEGPMRPEELQAAEERANYGPGSDYAFVPLYDVSASAGQGAFVNGERTTDALAFKKAWLHQQIGNGGQLLAIINVRGDSMEPTLRAGDVIMVNKAETEVVDGIYVFLLDGWLMVKRLQRRIGEGGGIELWAISEHPGYEPFQLPAFENFTEATRIIGRVVWAGRRF